jgi:hypothetical protein
MACAYVSSLCGKTCARAPFAGSLFAFVGVDYHKQTKLTGTTVAVQ